MIYLLLSLACAVSAVFSGPAQSRLADPIATPECKAWVDSVYNSMSERERIAQLFIPMMTPTISEANKMAMKKYVDAGVGGLLFHDGSLNDYAVMTNYAQSVSKVPLLMTLDGEWGAAMRIPDAPRFPQNMALGAIKDWHLLYDYGQEMARECKALGLQVNFAPVLDVNSNPQNPVIGYRSFGEDPERVALLGRAYSTGLENGGVMAVGKHFPGHGNTNVDSHKALPVISTSLDTLHEIDLYPFKKFIDANCNGVMVGHIALPAIDPSLAPASLSSAITSGLLKKELGFEGLVFTDGLAMKGADSATDRCVLALKAGADALLAPPSLHSNIAAIEKAVADGEIPRARIEESCKKMLAYKYALGLDKPAMVDVENISAIVNSPEADAVNTRLADAAATAIHNNGDILPIGDLAHRSIALVNIGAPEGNEFEDMCKRYAKVDVYNGEALSTASLGEIKTHDVVIAAVFSDNQAAQSAMASLKNVSGLIPVFMINPYKMGKFKHSLGKEQALVTVYDNTPYTRRAAAKALFGGIDVDGHLPVNVKGVAEMGAGVELKKSRLGYSNLYDAGIDPKLESRIDSVMAVALQKGAFPGAQVLIARGGDIVFEGCYGLTTKGGKQVTPYTLYDLASVSKTVGTLPGVMKAYDLQLFDLDTPVSTIIPGMNVEGKDDITPRMLLYHETGMQPGLGMFTTVMDSSTYTSPLVTKKKDKTHTVKIYDNCWGNKSAQLRKDLVSNKKTADFDVPVAKGMYVNSNTLDSIRHYIYTSPLRKNRNYCYSCLNFCLLMDMEERLTKQPHDQWVLDSVWAPIGAYNFCYRAVDKYPLSQIAATEHDTYLRKQHVHGYVHDELAAFSGGVQGNAGVFGTCTDIAKLCQAWLNGGEYGDARLFSPATTRLFTTSKTPNSRRGLGFDKPDTENSDNSPCCDQASASVYGHTGFTGTCFWVDPDYDLIYVFLANRVDPTRSNSSWTECAARSTIQGMIYDSINKNEE